MFWLRSTNKSNDVIEYKPKLTILIDVLFPFFCSCIKNDETWWEPLITGSNPEQNAIHKSEMY